MIIRKREVLRDVRNSKVRRQDKFRTDWSRHQNTCKSQNGTGPGARRSKRPLLACRTRCIWVILWQLNFSLKKAPRAYNFCFIIKRHVVFNWQSVGQIKTRINAQKYIKDWNKFIFWLFKCLTFLPSRFTVLVTHTITCIILPLSNIIICFKLSYPWKQTKE